MPGINRKCPACRQPAGPEDLECSLCGAPLYIECPSCGRVTPIEGNCRWCKASQYVVCPNPSCGMPQLVSPLGKCRSCGVSITVSGNSD